MKPDKCEKKPAVGDTGTILVIDDEPAVLRVMVMWLERLGHRVVSTTDSNEALKMIRKNPENFDVVVTDQSMPQIPGDRLAKIVQGLREDLPLILCTGFSSTIDEHEARRLGFAAFLLKPVLGKELSAAVNGCLGKRRGQGHERGSGTPEPLVATGSHRLLPAAGGGY